MITITLCPPDTIAVSMPYSVAGTDAIKTISGHEWHKPSKTWRFPISKLDRLIDTFPDQIEADPDVYLSAPPRLLGETFVANLRAAGVELADIDGRIVASGDIVTPPLQAEVDKRSAQIRRYIGAKPAIPALQVTTGEYASRATDADRAYFAGVVNARKAAEKRETMVNAKRAERYNQPTFADILREILK